MTIRNNYPLKKFTTMAIGGPARFFIDFQSANELKELLHFAKEYRLPWVVVGEGSKVVPADAGYAGVVMRNRIDFLKRKGSKMNVGAGTNLFATVKKLNQAGLAGFERMAGIPGTVGGAIYGCAGAYGQEIKDHLLRVKIFSKNKGFCWLVKRQCGFGYRESIFKKNKGWIIVGAEFCAIKA